MKIYTLTGDDGTTSLSGGKRVPKDSLRVEAYGSVDELIAWIGLLRDLSDSAGKKDILLYIQDQLMCCAAALASGESAPKCLPDENCLRIIESYIDKMEETLPPLKNFILPGGSIFVSYCHIARCVCRRTERRVIGLKKAEQTPDIIVKLLNRLSDFFFVLARSAGHESGYQEIKWPVR